MSRARAARDAARVWQTWARGGYRSRTRQRPTSLHPRHTHTHGRCEFTQHTRQHKAGMEPTGQRRRPKTHGKIWERSRSPRIKTNGLNYPLLSSLRHHGHLLLFLSTAFRIRRWIPYFAPLISPPIPSAIPSAFYATMIGVPPLIRQTTTYPPSSSVFIFPSPP